jgi:hypothetical protein
VVPGWWSSRPDGPGLLVATLVVRGAESAVIEGAAHGYFWQCPEESVRILLDWAARH